MKPQPCPCESGRAYTACCEPFHLGAVAPTAEALMRSRYSAYALRLEPYLLATWAAETRPAALDLHQDAAATKWLGLKVLRHEPVGEDEAYVEFVARYRIGGGSAVRMQERSRFLRREGRWYYLSGEFPQAA